MARKNRQKRDRKMPKKTFTEAQIVATLRRAESGDSVAR